MPEASTTTAAVWPTPERYARHKALAYQRPSVKGQRPWLIEQAQRRLRALLSHRAGALPWRVQGIRVAGAEHRGASALTAQLAGRALHYHQDKITPNGHQRLRRDQIVHTVGLLLGYYLDRANVQAHGAGRGERTLSWLEIRDTSLDDAAEALGLARSTVAAAEALLRTAGLLRSRQRREQTEDGYRQRPSQRWLAPHLFALLGLSRLYVKQLGHRPGRKKPATNAAPGPVVPATRPAASRPTPARTSEPDQHLDALSDILGRRRKPRS